MTTSKPLTMPRALKSKEVKERIYRKAVELMNQYGYEYVTIANICKAAEVSVGSFYHFYPSKEALLATFFQEAYASFAAAEDHACLPVLERIATLFCHYSDFCEKQGLAFIRNFYSTSNCMMDYQKHADGNAEVPYPTRNAAEEMIGEGIAQGVLKADTDASLLAYDLCLIQKGCVFEWCVTNGRVKLSALTKRMILSYLAAYQPVRND